MGEQGIDGATVTLAGDLDGDGLAEVGTITRIKLGSKTIPSHLAAGSQTLSNNWTGSLADRQIKAGTEKELTTESQNSTSP